MKRRGNWYYVKVSGKGGELDGWMNKSDTTNREAKGIEIREVKLTVTERKMFAVHLRQGREYIKKANNVEEIETGAEAEYYIAKAWQEFYKAYEINPNDLELLREIVSINYYSMGESCYEAEYPRAFERGEELQIEACNRALALNPPDKEWWYMKLANLYKRKYKISTIRFPNLKKTSIIMWDNAIKELEKKGN